MSNLPAYNKPSILTVDASEILEYLGPVQGLASGSPEAVGSVENFGMSPIVPMSDPTNLSRR